MTAVLAACVVLAAKTEGAILFAAHRVDYSDAYHVRYTTESQLYLFDVSSHSIKRVVTSSQDLITPAALGGGQIVYVSHDSKSLGNSLIFYDLRSGRRTAKTMIPDGDVDRITVHGGGKYLEVKYRVDSEYDADRFKHFKTKVSILKGATVVASYDHVANASVEPETGRIAVIGYDGKWSFEPPFPFGTPAAFRNVQGLPNQMMFADRHAYFISYSYEIGGSLTRSVDPYTSKETFPLSEFEFDKETPARWIEFEMVYGAWLEYDSIHKRELFHGIHGMSSGLHLMTAAINFEKKRLEPLCMGTYIYEDDKRRVYSVDSPIWVGEYHRGGLPEGKVFRYSADGKTKVELTSDSYDVLGACWLEGVM